VLRPNRRTRVYGGGGLLVRLVGRAVKMSRSAGGLCRGAVWICCCCSGQAVVMPCLQTWWLCCVLCVVCVCEGGYSLSGGLREICQFSLVN
jgi:hypothetical protein